MYIYKASGTEADSCMLKKAGGIIKNGGIIVFPTETVYGIGADALSSVAVRKVFAAKGRPPDNPLIVHVSSLNMLSLLTKDAGDVENKLIEAFWPGPLTIIFDKTDRVPLEVTGGLNSVAVRMPSCQIAQKIIEFANTPIAAPSANRSGRPSGTQVTDILNELKDFVDMFIDAGCSDIGVESTVVKVDEGVPTILRPGKITPADIERVAGQVLMDESVFSEHSDDIPALSPGMKYRHYSPDCDCLLVQGSEEVSKTNKIKEIAERYHPKKIVVLCATENASSYRDCENATIFPMGSFLDHNEISRNLFSLLRKAEEYAPSLIIIESVQSEGLGIALMNRLVRACGYNIVNC